MKKRWMIVLLAAACLLVGCAGAPAAGGMTELPTAPVDEGALDWYLGGDVSSIVEAEAHGRVFCDAQGEQKDVFRILRENGMNSVRIRIWNDPVDDNGVAYCDGHNDLPTAIQIGKRATEAGMQVFVDFHYSDHWADPAQQYAPKAWANMTLAEKEQALYDFTRDSLEQLLESGVNVTMVQVGNETTSGIAGEAEWAHMAVLMSAGSRAVRQVAEAYGREILVAMHFTGQADYRWFAGQLDQYGVDYDVFAASYYPYWHGTPEEQAESLKNVMETYGKQVVIAEFSYPYTLQGMDNKHNSVGAGGNADFAYPVTPSGQKQALEAALNMARSLGNGCLGLFYWEPVWLGYRGANGAGSPWENQALFDDDGHPLPALAVFLGFTKGQS